MRMLDFQNSAIAKMVREHPELQFAGNVDKTKNLFGDDSPSAMAAGLGGKLGDKKPSMMNVQMMKKSAALRSMKFMNERLGG